MKNSIDPPILDIWDEPMSFANRVHVIKKIITGMFYASMVLI